MPIQEKDILRGHQYKAGEKGEQLRVVLGFTLDDKVVYAYTTANPSPTGDPFSKNWNRQKCEKSRFAAACFAKEATVKADALNKLIELTNAAKSIIT